MLGIHKKDGLPVHLASRLLMGMIGCDTMGKFTYYFVDGTCEKVDLEELPANVRAALLKHENKELWQPRSDARFRDGDGYVEGESEQHIAEVYHSDTVADAIVSMEHNEQLLSVIAKLTGRQQQRLYYYSQGYSYSEISRFEGVSEAAVRQAIKRTRKKLKQILKKHSDLAF